MTSKEAILQAIGTGAKGVNVVAEAVELLCRNKTEEILYENLYEDLPASLAKMVLSGEIVEIEYTIPDQPHRIKSFYLPKGSKVIGHSA